MKKIYLKLTYIFFLSIYYFNIVNAWVINLWGWELWNWVSGAEVWTDSLSKMNSLWINILHSLKMVLGGIALIYIIYIWIQMIMSMWADEKLSTAKRQLLYALVAFIFINIPGQLYDIFSWKERNVTDISNFTDVTNQGTWNMFINFFNWNSTVEGGILGFVKIFVAAISIYMFVFSGLSYMSSNGKDDIKKKAKWRFLYWFFGLIFLWVIEAWIKVVYNWNIPQTQWIFAQLSNLAIFFAGPITIFFLILWGFYYITSAGDEAKAKKWIAIIKYTFIAVIILLASYSFLKDLADFSL
ncbi:MAG: hypothetical protein ACD_49C00060G0007 [uncultured bacterium (gcode 4)]|uniref:Uncharacterized protein n=1 Tax=uncultured bacterium (gcode 4) TaxID=1234023 RepID=K2ADS0_9BACT|nr:MAG: hypothetical protein ACD_49C00060G0007 [uncultured bacterium (gcode 4)]